MHVGAIFTYFFGRFLKKPPLNRGRPQLEAAAMTLWKWYKPRLLIPILLYTLWSSVWKKRTVAWKPSLHTTCTKHKSAFCTFINSTFILTMIVENPKWFDERGRRMTSIVFFSDDLHFSANEVDVTTWALNALKAERKMELSRLLACELVEKY